MLRSKFFRIILIVLALIFATWFTIAALYVPDFPIRSPERRQIGRMVGNRQFNLFAWEVDALFAKSAAAIRRAENRLDADEQKQIVLDYLAINGEARRLNRELELIYAVSKNPNFDSAELAAELAQVRAESAEIRPIAESILQNQIATILKQEEMQLAQSAWPPVQARVTPLPLMLIVSPRDRIEQQIHVSLAHGLPIPERDGLEASVFEELGLSALVVPIGGLATYPAMIQETDNINSLVRVMAHEWAHHWLALHPLGRNYATRPELRTINETAADVVGREVGDQVIEMFYPEFVPPKAAESHVKPVETVAQPLPFDFRVEPPPFDFRAEMGKTRVRVDELLAAGEVEAAEAYMEERRLVFVENRYLVRKLNQAYFAFYGAYAAAGGATGGDPVGPAVVTLRAQSPSLRAFLTTIAPIVSFEELSALVE